MESHTRGVVTQTYPHRGETMTTVPRIPPLDVVFFIVGALLFGGALTAIIITQGPGAFTGPAQSDTIPVVSLTVENFTYTALNGVLNATGSVVNLDTKPITAVVVTITGYDAGHHARDHELLTFNGTLQPGERWPFNATFCPPKDTGEIAGYEADVTGRTADAPGLTPHRREDA